MKVFDLPEGWKFVSLYDLVDVIGGVSYSPEDITSSGIRVIRGGNIQGNLVELRDDDVYLPVTYKNSENTLYKGDIVLVASTGSVEALGRTATVWENMENVQIGAFLRILRPKHPKYAALISSWLSSEHYFRYIRLVAKGTSINNISLSHIKGFKIPIPPDEKATSFTALYNAVAKKININRAINQNLEALAKQLYDYWFVQFDFPNEEGKPYKSSDGAMVWNEKLKRYIPEGWKVLPLFDAVSVQYGFPFTTEQFTEEKTSVPVVRIRDILEGTTSAFSLEKADEKYHLNEGDVLVGMDGNFHMNFWHDNIAYLNQRCVRLRPHSDSTISSIQILHSIKPYIKAKEQNAKGSTVGHLSDKDLKGLFLVKPLNSKTFNPRKMLDGLLALVIENKRQILSLTKQRDELLPLLLNGQVTTE